MPFLFEKAFRLSADTLTRMQAAHDPARVGAIRVERMAA